tara:strand:+ start:7352 stop:8188 length:837 start_codon:yes stop_codon:yes gene_type:complete
MARKSASQALESYRNRSIGNLSRKINSIVKTRRAELDAATFVDPEEQEGPPKPSDILKEYKARIEIGKMQEQELERKQMGLTPLEYEKEKASYKKDVQTGQTEYRTLQRTLATEERTAIRDASKLSAKDLAKSDEAVEQEKVFQDKIKRGAGFLPSTIRGEFPRAETSFSLESDIAIIVDPADAPDRTKTRAYFTLDDINFMIKNNEFDKAGISKDVVMNALGIDSSTGKASMALPDVQKLIFDFLQTPYGKGMATAQKMKFKDPSVINVSKKIRLVD